MNFGEPSPNPMEMADHFRSSGHKVPHPSWNRVNLPENDFFYLNIKLGEELLLLTFSISTILKKFYLVKMCPIFDGSAPRVHSIYQKIL